MKEWIQKNEKEKIDLLRLVASRVALPDYMVEKDWWVTIALESIFTCEIKDHFAFKGGTSLSKSWSILQRFSEDIDIVIGKELFGLSDEAKPGRTQRERLRDEAHLFVMNKVLPILRQRLKELNIPDNTFNIYSEESRSSDQDPTVLLLDYKPLIEIPNGYTLARIQIEIGVRAMMEPTEERMISSLLSQNLNNSESFGVRTVLPQRTFWEKAFLLHELFQKPLDKIDIRRMSRHWYDLYCLKNAGFAEKAFTDKDLFDAIRDHRGVFTKVPGVDYSVLKANSFNLFPPKELKENWEKDYAYMRESYIYKNAPSIEMLYKEVKELNDSLSTLGY